MLGTQEMGISPAEAGERRSRTSEANTGPCSLPQFSTETLQKETDTFPSQVAFFKHPFSPGDHLLCTTQLRLSSRLLMSQIPYRVPRRGIQFRYVKLKVFLQRFVHHSSDSSKPISPLNSYQFQNSRNVSKQVFKLITSTCAETYL